MAYPIPIRVLFAPADTSTASSFRNLRLRNLLTPTEKIDTEILFGITMDSRRLDRKLARVIGSNMVEIRDVTVASDIFAYTAQ